MKNNMSALLVLHDLQLTAYFETTYLLSIHGEKLDGSENRTPEVQSQPVLPCPHFAGALVMGFDLQQVQYWSHWEVKTDPMFKNKECHHQEIDHFKMSLNVTLNY